MPDDIETRIEEGALEPESAAADGVSTKQRSLRELIEADKYLAMKVARRSSPVAIIRGHLFRIVPPGV